MLETHTDHSRHSHALKLYTRRPQHRWLATAPSPGGHYPSRAVHSRHCHHTWSLRLCPSADTSSQPRQHGPGQRTALAAPGPPFVPRSIAGSPPFQQRHPTPWLLSSQSDEGEPGGVLSKPRKEQGTRAQSVSGPLQNQGACAWRPRCRPERQSRRSQGPRAGLHVLRRRQALRTCVLTSGPLPFVSTVGSALWPALSCV